MIAFFERKNQVFFDWRILLLATASINAAKVVELILFGVLVKVLQKTRENT